MRECAQGPGPYFSTLHHDDDDDDDVKRDEEAEKIVYNHVLTNLKGEMIFMSETKKSIYYSVTRQHSDIFDECVPDIN